MKHSFEITYMTGDYIPHSHSVYCELKDLRREFRKIIKDKGHEDYYRDRISMIDEVCTGCFRVRSDIKLGLNYHVCPTCEAYYFDAL